MKDWEEVIAFACALPEVEMGPHFGTMVPKVNGKSIVGPSRERDSFGVKVSMDEKHLLIETDPETFWETPHYANYPAVLVRYGADAADERVQLYIRRAWWDRLKKAQRVKYGERP